jgi:SanA protein
MIRVLRRLRWKPVWACLLVLLTFSLINLWITRSAKSRTFNRLDQLPANDVGLVLGSSARVRGGFPNPHFQNRVEAAAKLYQAGKVKHLLLSGDNHTASYDEPTDLQDALLKLGVPRSSMTLDYAGFRTLDSIARAKTVFGLSRLTIITDDFHSQRALFISRSYGVDAVAFCSKSVPFKYSSSTRMREWFARIKAFLDVYALRTQPKFYGPKIEIIIEPYQS